jgi:ABC-2 type transport system permease protein
MTTAAAPIPAPAPAPTDEVLRLTTSSQAARAFRGLRWRLSRNTVRAALSGSRLRLIMIVFCSAVFWAMLFGLFFKGFQFIGMYVDLVNTIIEYIFSMFFLSLMVMLFFSTGILTYTGLFQSREAAYLLTTPAQADRIFAYKFAEAIGFSSWGFLLLGSPMMVAYGITVQATGAFYGVFVLYLLAFVLVPGCLGAVAAVLVANFFPRRQKTIFALSVAILLAVAVMLVIRLVRTPGEPMSTDWLGGLLQKLDWSQNPLWPSRWTSAGLMAAAKGDWNTGMFYLMVLSAHAGLAYLLAAVVARDLYRAGYSRV